MAGSYPDPPGLRMAYDRDGSAVIVHDGSTAPTQLTTTSVLQHLNDESTASDYSLPSGKNYFGVIFPQLRDFTGFGAAFGDAGTYTVQTSPDTTNGIDGTWTNRATGVSNTAFSPAGPLHRTALTAVSVGAIKAVRFLVAGLAADRTVYGVHLYGSITAGQTPDRLVFSDTLDNPLTAAFFDWGDVPQGSSADRPFRVRNNSSTMTASTITVSVEALTDTTPAVASQYLLSTDGVTFGATASITTLGPGAHQNLWVRRVTPSNATLSLWDARVVASAASFA